MNAMCSMIRTAATGLVVPLVVGLLVTSPALGADPLIQVAWEEPDPPLLNFDYRVSTDPPASFDFPDVELVTGSLTWRIWSKDADNPDNVGDIGVISCPHADNFAVTIHNLSHPSLHGARHVKGIILAPTSSSNYSNIAAGVITGDLLGDLVVQADTFGTGGEVSSMLISGTATGNITIEKVGGLDFGAVSGTMTINELATSMTIADLSGAVSVNSVTGQGVSACSCRCQGC